VPPKSPFKAGKYEPVQTSFGVLFQQNRFIEPGSMTNVVEGCTFAAYNPRCKISAAIGLGASRWDYWSTGNQVKNLRFDSVTVTNKVYIYPEVFTEYNKWVYNGGEVATMAAIQDMDGSILGKAHKQGGTFWLKTPKSCPPPLPESSAPPSPLATPWHARGRATALCGSNTSNQGSTPTPAPLPGARET